MIHYMLYKIELLTGAIVQSLNSWEGRDQFCALANA